MTALISEFRSMTFQCKSEISSSIQFSEINSYVGRDHIMAPQQLDSLPKSSEQILNSEKARENQVSPISSLGGTSMESSSPAMLNEATPENIKGNYEMDLTQKHDLSSDDSGSMANELSGYQDELRSPLEQLQCSLGKDGMLGQKLNLSEYPGQKDDIRNSSNASLSSAEQSCIYYDSSELYKCHLCTYASNSKQEFDIHMDTHFDHKCPYCDYTSRTEGRLKRHVKDFHSETPPESWAGARVPRAEANGSEQSMDDSVTSSNGKMRSYRCKQCDFVAYQKNDFWEHHKTHIKVEKLLSCPQCAFVTEYKHHLEYHIRNHFGSKPFKCSKCNYSCVNKSMLNSHMKSHSNIYQYRCDNCTYATKYCHSLKLHLRKYGHKPATVLNLDGTPNPYPVIDVYGTRRGPRTKKRRMMEDSNNSVSSTAVVPSQPPMSYPPAVPLLPTNVPATYPQFFNSYPSYTMAIPHVRVKHDNTFKCIMCDFVTDHEEIHHKHMILHAASENPDLIKLYGINSDSLIHFQDQMAFNNYVQSQRHYMEHLQRKSFDAHDIQKGRSTIDYGMEEKNIKDEEESNISYQKDVKNSSPRNDSRKAVPSPSYVYDSESLIHKERQERDNSEEQERSVIVAHKSSPIPTTQQQMETDACNSQNKNVEHSPLDLSGSKQFDPSTNADERKRQEINQEKQSPELKNASPNSDPSSVSSACQRNRRKGKAFKINHYIQYDDHPLNSEIIHKEKNKNNNDVLHNSGMEQSNEEIVSYFKQDSQRFSPISNNKLDKSLSPKQPQNMQFLISNSVKPLSRNEYSSPSHTSPSPHEFLGAFNKSSSSTVPKTNGFMPKERNEVTKSNSSYEPAVHPKLETDVEQSSTISIQPEIFECDYCAMAFRDCTMYTVHMGFHGYGNPFTCNMCGQQNKDRVEFYIHIARAAHG